MYQLMLLFYIVSYLKSVENFSFQCSRAKLSILGQSIQSFETTDDMLRSKLQREVLKMKNVSTSALVEELKNLGLSTKSIADRDTLEKFLSIYRVHKYLSEGQRDEYEKRLKRWESYKILSEMREIRKMSMSELVHELHRRNIDIDPSSERSQIELVLAKSRVAKLDNIDPTISSNLEVGFGKNIAFLYESIFGDFKSTLQSAKMKIGQSFQTDAEREAARRLIVNRLIEKKNLEGRKIEKSVFTVTNIPANSSELDNFIADLNNMEGFDEIKAWGEQQPRDFVRQIMERLGLHVPQYAARSSLAATLADAIMSNRTFARKETSTIEGNYSSSLIDDNSLISIDANQNTLTPSATISTELSQFESFAVEKELIDTVISKIVNGSLGVLRRLSNIPRNGRTYVQDVYQKGSSSDLQISRRTLSVHPAVRFLWSINSLIINQLQSVAAWAGGSLLPRGQVLFISALYAVLSRRGVTAFMAAIIFIKSLSVVYDR